MKPVQVYTTCKNIANKLVNKKGLTTCANQEGGGGTDPPPPWKITKTQGSLAKLVLIPLKITKQPSQHSMLSHHRHASETPFKWWPANSSILILPPLIRPKNVKVAPPLTKTFWIRLWTSYEMVTICSVGGPPFRAIVTIIFSGHPLRDKLALL